MPLDTPRWIPFDGSAAAFDRARDGSIIRINSHNREIVTKASVLASFLPILERQGLDHSVPASVELLGDPIGADFILRFGGSGKFAESKRDGFLKSLQPPGRKKPEDYIRYLGKTPSGKDVQLYTERDANGRDQKAKREIRLLAKIFREELPHLFNESPDSLFVNIAAAEITKRRRTLVALKVEHSAPTLLSWNLSMATELGLVPSALQEKFLLSDRTSGNVTLSYV